ncbi:MAG: DUF302 domain-containing protein [Gammaproteobacteria bacterium]|nr:DUF302 domain-containing protein [Gammaproteobacteria bacterium]
MKRFAILFVLLVASGVTRADVPGVLHWDSAHDLEVVYNSVYKSLEENRFFVVFEPNIGRNLAGFAERWGDDYNRNGLQGIRAMVFCNGWYANQVSNLEPQLLALCPLHLSVYRQGDRTHVVFVRPGLVGKDSKAEALLQELEADVSKAIEQGLSATQP